MSVKTAMTAIADKIRALLGLSGTMGLDAMATNLTTEQTNVTNAFTAIGNKGGTVPTSQVSGNLASAIASIPAGVTVKRKTDSSTTNTSGVATINCGFSPDIVTIGVDGKVDYGGTSYMVVDFAAISIGAIESATWLDDGIMTCEISVNDNGFNVEWMEKWDIKNNQYITQTNKSFSYTAIKYTE